MIAKSTMLLSTTIACALLVAVGNVDAATKCRETIVNGRVVDRTCVKTPKYRKVCDYVWRNGIRYRECRKVPLR